MVARRRNTRRAKSKKAVVRRKVTAAKEKDPGYMVQLTEPSLLRRDLLETLREVILFMQSYEKFKRVQQDKVHLFTSLKTDLKELNMLLGTKMKAHFPQGKLHAITEEDQHAQLEEEHGMEVDVRSSIPVSRPLPAMRPLTVPKEDSRNELDQLEDQLRDIESQLKQIQ